MSELAALIGRCTANLAPMTNWEAAYLDRMKDWSAPPSALQIATLERIANRIATSDIGLMLAERIEEVAQELTGEVPSYRQGTEIRFGENHGLSIKVAGDKRGVWHDHRNGEGGGALGLVAYLRGSGQADAIQWAKLFLRIGNGGHLPERKMTFIPSPDLGSGKTVEIARQIWREAVSAAGTVVEAYLASRGLWLPSAHVLRFHPACLRDKEKLPAMVALMTDAVTGEARGIHRTYLQADGKGKAPGNAKMMLGQAGVIRFVEDTDVTGGLGLAEGIETALSVIQVVGWSPVWAATSAGAISNFPVLPGIEALTIFADADKAGDRAAESCADRWVSKGREVTIHRPPEGYDWNDVARVA